MPDIIDATLKDIPVIQSLSHKIWPSAFSQVLTPSQIDYMLRWMYSPSSLKEQMNNQHQFLLIKDNGKYCGYCSYQHNGKTTKLHKIYLLPEKWGFGLGKIFLQEVIARAKVANQEILQLHVNRYNKAVMFYEKAGFKIISEEDHDIGNDYFMNDYVMELRL